MVKKIDIPKDNNIVKIAIEEAMPDNYLPYAVEVAKDRALPDVRDGLKPVHRRIIYGAYLLKAFPDRPYFKSARIVGDILGKFHPHGDSSVYDSMVILAQSFSTRKPLIDGHGNWGSTDGDSAAAMRYTEARLTPIALEMIRDIDKNVVDMAENYSGTELEPTVLPSRYPNLLVNGTFGIAVGLATNIPPHNLGEVIDASLAYMNNKEITTEELMHYIKGPDLPTGGTIIGKNALLSAYATGEGKVTLRAKTKIEMLESGKYGIVITEFPYRKNKARILQNISDMTCDKKHVKALENIIDIRDESDRTGIRAVVELKKTCDLEGAEKILKYLYKKTELQSNISFNMVALANGKPETMGLKTILHHYIEHQKDIVKRRTKTELEIAKKRFHIVEGFIKAIDILDEIISVIRASKSKTDSENNLMDKFGFTQMQAQAIVELMLYRLTGLEIKTFEKEYKELQKIITKLTKILENEKELLRVITDELTEIKEKYNDKRRTEIIEDDTEAKIDVEELIIVEDTVITMSNEGYIKRIPQKTVNRSNTDVETIEYREGDFNKYLINSNTTDMVILFTDKGNMYQIKGNLIPEMKWKEKGEKIDTLIKGLDLGAEKVINVFSIPNFTSEKSFVFVSSKGSIKKSLLSNFTTNYSKLTAIKLKKQEELVYVDIVDAFREPRFIKVRTEKGLNFSMEEPKIEESDRNTASVQLCNLSPSDNVVDIEFMDDYEYKIFKISISKKGLIKLTNSTLIDRSASLSCVANSNSKILIFINNGLTISVPAFMLQNITEDGLNIYTIFEDFINEKDKIVSIIAVENFEEDNHVFFFTKEGYVKKTRIKELQSTALILTTCKLKSDKDELINVCVKDKSEEEILIITLKGMAIRFDVNSVNEMGKTATGVLGISLKEDDLVIFAQLIDEKSHKINLSSKLKNEKEVSIQEIKPQNRAGVGRSIMLVVMEDFIYKVGFK